MSEIVAWIERHSKLAITGASLGLGLLFSTGFDPLGWRWLALASLVGFFFLFSSRSTVKANAWMGFVFGLGWFIPGLSWTMNSIAIHGHLPWVVAGLGLFLLACVLSIFLAVACALARRLGGEHPSRAVFALTGFWLLTEWCRGDLLANFGWLQPGYAALDTPLMGWALLGGVYAVTLMMFVSAALLWQALSCQLKWVWAPFLGLVVVFGVGQMAKDHTWSHASSTLDVRVLQPALPIVDAYTKADTATRVVSMLPEAEKPWAPSDRPRLLLTPEGVVNGLVNRLSGQAASELMSLQEKSEALVLFNGFRQEGRRIFNTSFVLGEGHIAYRLDKRELVPFGEFVPAGARWFVDLIGIPMADLTPGDGVQPLLQIGQTHIGILICYENLYGNVVRSFWQTHSPDFLIVTSNLGWFGRSVVSQHLAMSRVRAIESARPLVSVNNSGLSAVVNSKGEIVKALSETSADAMTVPLLGATGSPTPYIRFGAYPFLFLALLFAFNGFFLQWREKNLTGRLHQTK